MPGEDYSALLPATGRKLSFNLPLGPTPAAGWQAEAIIEVASQGEDPGTPAVSVNDIAAELSNAQSLDNGNRLLTYSVPTSALPGKNHDTIDVTAAGEKPMKLLGVEARVFLAIGQ